MAPENGEARKTNPCVECSGIKARLDAMERNQDAIFEKLDKQMERLAALSNKLMLVIGGGTVLWTTIQLAISYWSRK